MRRHILDTNILVGHWKKCGGDRLAAMAAADGRDWGRELVDLYDSNLILSPIYIEFICGARNQLEYKTAQAYLAAFTVLDEWNVTPDDLREARRLAQRIPRDGRPRQLGDCLIRAMASRFGADVKTLENRFPK